MTGTVRPTRAQAHRLIETYGYSGTREPAVDRLTTAELFLFDAPRRDRLELDTDASGEPVSWVAQAQIDSVERSETVILCRRNVPIAEIRPLPKPPTEP